MDFVSQCLELGCRSYSISKFFRDEEMEQNDSFILEKTLKFNHFVLQEQTKPLRLFLCRAFSSHE